MGVSPTPGYPCTSLAQSALISSLKLISRVKAGRWGLNVVPSPLAGILPGHPRVEGVPHVLLLRFPAESFRRPSGLKPCLDQARPLGSCQPHLPPYSHLLYRPTTHHHGSISPWSVVLPAPIYQIGTSWKLTPAQIKQEIKFSWTFNVSLHWLYLNYNGPVTVLDQLHCHLVVFSTGE